MMAPTPVPLLVAAAVLAGCGLLPSDEPEWIRGRQPLPACGDVTLRGIEDPPPEMDLCLAAGLRNGRGAEAIIRYREVQGGPPIDAYTRVLPDGTGELIHHVGPGSSNATWELIACARVTPDSGGGALAFGDCQQPEVP
jgi:hypothetical protein